MSTPRDWQGQADEWATQSVAVGRPTEWFERLWAAGRAGEVTMPWDHAEAHPVLADWLAGDGVSASGRAVVIGCGLGADAEAVAAKGLDTVGFDLSESAIAEAAARHQNSAVDYVVADLLEPPREWHRAFDLVVEIYTVQAVPGSMRPRMTAAVTDLVAPGGSLLVIQMCRETTEAGDGPPWPLSRAEVEAFGSAHGLEQVALDSVEHRASGPAAVGRALPSRLRRPTATCLG